MKSQRKIYKALWDGEKLDNGDFWCYLNKAGNLVDDEGCMLSLDFNDYSSWQIYKEPKWYENIPDGGVLCWCTQEIEADIFIHNIVGCIIRHEPETNFANKFVLKSGALCGSAIPLTEQEIQVFMYNAPETVK